MKLRKTRIEKSTKANGSVQFLPQFKWGFWWYRFSDMMAPVGEVRHIFCTWVKTKEDNLTYSEQEAKEVIDFYIARVKYNNACDIENKIVKKEYHRYP